MLEEDIIFMCDMQALEVGVIVDEFDHSTGHTIMRTASMEHFEVMDLTDLRPSSCWTSGKCKIKVKLFNSSDEITLGVSNDKVKA